MQNVRSCCVFEPSITGDKFSIKEKHRGDHSDFTSLTDFVWMVLVAFNFLFVLNPQIPNTKASEHEPQKYNGRKQSIYFDKTLTKNIYIT